MRIELDSVVTLPTDERALGEPRCCCKRYCGFRAINRTRFSYTAAIRPGSRAKPTPELTMLSRVKISFTCMATLGSKPACWNTRAPSRWVAKPWVRVM